MNRFDALRSIYNFNSFRFSVGDSLKSMLDPLKKRTVRLLEAVARSGSCGLTSLLTKLAHLGWHTEEQGQVRARSAYGKINDRLDQAQIQLSAVALVCCGGVVETVTQHDLTGFKRRPNNLAHELGATCVHQ